MKVRRDGRMNVRRVAISGAQYPAGPLLEKEHQHRRVLLVAIGTMLALGTSPVFGHHLAVGLDGLLAGRDHIFNVCLIALHLLLAPVHYSFHVLIIAGILYATWDRARAFLGLRGALGQTSAQRVRLAGPMLVAAQMVGIPASRLRVVEGLPNPAFTAGFWRPRIYVAASLPELLSEAELASVLAHEKAHMERRDPLRLSLLRFLACTLFFLPALRRLADDVADEAEIIADDAAAQGGALTLASAIMAFVEHRDRFRFPARGIPPHATVGFHRDDLLERRVRRLLGEAAPVKSHITRRSLAGAAVALSAVWISGLVMTHPLPAATHHQSDQRGGSHSSHCLHHSGFAFNHLFCLDGAALVSGTCPHTSR